VLNTTLFKRPIYKAQSLYITYTFNKASLSSIIECVKPLSSTAGKILLSIDMEVMMSFPTGKMLDMEATLAGGRAEFFFSAKHWFKLEMLL